MSSTRKKSLPDRKATSSSKKQCEERPAQLISIFDSDDDFLKRMNTSAGDGPVAGSSDVSTDHQGPPPNQEARLPPPRPKSEIGAT